MPRIVWTPTPESAAPWAGGILPAFDPEIIAQHRADTHLVLVGNDDLPLARASLWWNQTPLLNGKRLGAIGHYTATDEASARLLLKAACQRLGGMGCALAVGPMDGNTWRRFRWMTERGEEPVFWMEPDNPDAWPTHWRAAGFGVMATYVSALNDNLEYEDAQVTRAGERLRSAGVTIRPLNTARLDEELRRIHTVLRQAFPENFLYTPTPEAEFLARFSGLRDQLRAELVLLAEHAGLPLGYVFAPPDGLRGAETDTVVIQTVAVVPGRANAGLGAWLVARVQFAARKLGYRRAIHALMHESTNALNLSARYAKPFRRHTLFSRAP